MTMFTITGVLSQKAGGAKLEFNCTVHCSTVDEALNKFNEVYSPDSYTVKKIHSVETL